MATYADGICTLICSEYAASVSYKLWGAVLVTSDLCGRFRAGDHAVDCVEWAPYAGCSDADIEGSPSSINDGESVNCTLYLLYGAVKIHAVMAEGCADVGSWVCPCCLAEPDDGLAIADYICTADLVDDCSAAEAMPYEGCNWTACRSPDVSGYFAMCSACM